MNVWGVTGTNGKTTTAWVLGELLGGEARCGHVTTVEVWTGRRRFSSGYTTPPLPVLRERPYMERPGGRDEMRPVRQFLPIGDAAGLR